MEGINNYFQSRKMVIGESIRVIRRSPEKYSKMVLGIWLMPLVIRGTNVAKDAYFFMRHIDDVLDGDLEVRQDPLQYVEEIKKSVKNKSQSENKICVLAERSLKILDQRKRDGDDPRSDFVNGIEGMMKDYKRAQTRELLSEKELKQNYIDSFGPHHNISLIGVGSTLRSRDMEVFSYCQGLAYGVQDLDVDWQRGLLNIPSEVLLNSGLNMESSVGEVKNNLMVTEWMKDELSDGSKHLEVFLKDISLRDNEKAANLFLGGLAKRVKTILNGDY